MTMGERLKKARLKKDKTLDKAANEIDISTSYLSELEKDKQQNPSTKTLNKLSDYYNISIDYILGKSNIINNDIKIPEGIAELLNEGEQKFLKETLNKENTSMLLRETKGMSDKDLATAISLIKAYKNNK